MPAAVPAAPAPAPRRARSLIPRDFTRRNELIAALTMAGLLAGFLFAQLTGALAVAFYTAGKAARWRPGWLTAPAAAGAVWALAIGPATALRRLTAAPSALLSLLGRVLTDPARIPRLARIPGILSRLVPGQFPAALILAAGLAAAAWWLEWLHTDEWDLPEARPGPGSRCRLAWTTAFVRSGAVLTRRGVCLGAELATGAPAEVTWREAGSGVLVTGASAASVHAAGFQFAHGAVRRRKALVVVDLGGSPSLPDALAAACLATGAPLHVFGQEGRCWYDPLAGREPATAAGLVTSMIDWSGVAEQARLACGECLAAAFAVAAAIPPSPEASTLRQVTGLLSPGALGTALAGVPPWLPGRAALAQRVQAAQSWLGSQPATAALAAGQLTALAAAGPGRWLGPAAGGGAQTGVRRTGGAQTGSAHIGGAQGGGAHSGGVHSGGVQISLEDVVRQRGVALFRLDPGRSGRAATMIANLVAADLAAVYGQAGRAEILADGMAWFTGCEAVAPELLTRLVSLPPGTPLATVLATTEPAAAARLAGQVGVCLAHRLDNAELAGRLAALTGTRLRPAPFASAAPGAAMPGAAPAGTAWPEVAAPSPAPRARPAPAPWQPGYRAAGGPVPVPALVPEPVLAPGILCGLPAGDFFLIAGGGDGPAPGYRGHRLPARCRSAVARVPRPSQRRRPARPAPGQSR
jgi:hypothetical protein